LARGGRLALAALTLAVLAGCASRPGGGARPGRDGAGADPPANLAQVPDAEPRLESIRAGGPNKPYVVLGRAYTPMDADAAYRDSGLASWYGRKFHGASTSSGEPYDMYAMTAAHPTLPLPSYVRVRNPANGREVVVRVNDRGPFHDGRIIDLSYTAAFKLDLLRGVAPVEVERITPTEITSGNWRRGGAATALAQAVVPVPSPYVAPVAYVPPAPVQAPVDIVATPLPPLSPLPPLPPLAEPVVATTAAAAGSLFWVQLGAFSRPDGASALQRRADGLASGMGVTVLQDGALNRVQAGPFASREAARDAAGRLGDALQLAPVVVERR